MQPRFEMGTTNLYQEIGAYTVEPRHQCWWRAVERGAAERLLRGRIKRIEIVVKAENRLDCSLWLDEGADSRAVKQKGRYAGHTHGSD